MNEWINSSALYVICSTNCSFIENILSKISFLTAGLRIRLFGHTRKKKYRFDPYLKWRSDPDSKSIYKLKLKSNFSWYIDQIYYKVIIYKFGSSWIWIRFFSFRLGSVSGFSWKSDPEQVFSNDGLGSTPVQLHPDPQPCSQYD